MSEVKLPPPNVKSFLNMRDVYLEALDELAKPYPSFKLPQWGYFNKMVGGFRTREFSILCGPTGKGKTTFLANMSKQLIEAGVKNFVMSVETGHTDYMKRIMSVYAGEDLNTGEAIPADRLVQLSANHFRTLNSGLVEFSIYDNRVPVEQLMADLKYAVEVLKCKVAFVDNLNFFLSVGSEKNMFAEMDRVVHELIIFCKRTDVHLVMVMHPKKTDHGRVENEFDIKGSSLAVQEAHNVFLFNPPHPNALTEGKRSPFDREVKIAKLRRRGAYVGRTIVFKNHQTRYEEESMF